jgi:cytochrome c biogenesis factor
VLPGLAFLNMLFGGSSYLVKYYLLLLAIFAFLNFAGEIKWMKTFNTLTSVFLGISLFIVIPVYVLYAFTEMSINNVFSHAVLKSPWWRCFGIWRLMESAWRLILLPGMPE